MKLYNTLTRKKEELKKPLFRKLKLFICGPTVYDHIHIGNFRTYVFFDAIVKYWRSLGLKLFYLQNITDIDDKIIQRAKDEGRDWKELAEHFEKSYKDKLELLNITAVDEYARSTDFIPEIIDQIKRLIRKGYAYEIESDPAKGEEGGWYFDISKFADYGKLARRTVEQAEDGVSRIDQNEKKRNKGDFALWKFSKEGEPSWESELGNGRPGWHIEDTAISEKYFGPQYDIHGAGIDLIFPHHEAEIAQQEAASGKEPFVKYWIHCGHLTVNGAKMSKSKGNFISMDDFLKKFSANTFRFIVLLNHYRSSMEFNLALAGDAQKNLSSIVLFIQKLKMPKNAKGVKVDLKKYRDAFQEALANDFNTPKALAIIFSLFNAVNKKVFELEQNTAKDILQFLQETFSLLGFKDLLPKIPDQVQALIRDRELSRDSKQFDKSDDLREEIESLGYIVEDTPRGPVVIPKAN